jgi:acetate kinase
MIDTLLVLNAGSSSIKFSLFAADPDAASLPLLYHGEVDGLGHTVRFVAHDGAGRALADEALTGKDHDAALEAVLRWIERHSTDVNLVGVGHRVVHGGIDFSAPVKIDPAVLTRLERLVPLAPLHQPHNLAPIRALARMKPDLPQVACFDTAFHRTQPSVARTFALPRELTEAGIERYGFHGLSYEHIAHVLPTFAGNAAGGRVIVAHLGNGASMCAMRERQSIATTMGFTALDGLPMGTRSGALDPGVLLHLLIERGMNPDTLTDLLYHRSGLLGVSGVSSDMRALLTSASPAAAFAIDLFVYRIGRELGSLAAALGGVDVLVFTGGIGEHAVPVRARVCEEARWLGVSLDTRANADGGPRISAADSRVSVWVIATDEEQVIARHARRLLRA